MTCRRAITGILIAWTLLSRPSWGQQTDSFRSGQGLWASVGDSSGGAASAGYAPGAGYQSVYPMSGSGGGRYGSALYSQPPGGLPAENATYGPATPHGRLGQALIRPSEDPNAVVGATDPAAFGGYATPYTAIPGQGYYGPDGIVTKRIADEDDWDENGPVEKMLATVARNSWFRAEYLLWTIDAPSQERLGAPLANNTNLDFFTVLDPLNFPQQLGFGTVYNTNRLSLEDTNGVRLTMGLPTMMGGDLEFSGFLLDKAGDKDAAPFLPSPAPPFGRFAATSLLSNGQPGALVLLWDEAFVVSYESEVWGADVKYVMDLWKREYGFRVNPLFGARFLQIREKMVQKGVYNNFRTIPDLVGLIESEANNNIWGPMLGGRIEFTNPYFSIGAEPKISLGPNRYLARVKTDNLRSLADGEVQTQEENTIFAPILEATVYGRIHISENFSVHAGYNWLYATNITRPARNIYYNDNGAALPPGVVVDAKTDQMMIQGLTVGADIRFK